MSAKFQSQDIPWLFLISKRVCLPPWPQSELSFQFVVNRKSILVLQIMMADGTRIATRSKRADIVTWKLQVAIDEMQEWFMKRGITIHPDKSIPLMKKGLKCDIPKTQIKLKDRR